MYLCDRCQLGVQVGMNVSHSHRRTKKHSLPNLHVITVRENGKNKTMRLCTKCTRIIRKEFPFKIEPAHETSSVKKEEVTKESIKEEPTKEKEAVPAV